MKTLSMPLAILTLFILSGCGGDSGFSGGTNTATVSSFDGTWSNGCKYNQLTGIAENSSITISGNASSIDIKTYENSNCSGIASNKQSSRFNLTYPGQIALNNCFNAQKVNSTILFPISFNEIEFSEEQFNALPASIREEFSPILRFDLMCVNRTGTLLFLGDSFSGQGTTDNNRPTRAALSAGINKIR